MIRVLFLLVLLLCSTVHAQIFPPPFNGTLTGNLNVSGTSTHQGATALQEETTLSAQKKLNYTVSASAGTTANTAICNGTTGVTVNTSAMVASNLILFSLNTLGGTQGNLPRVTSVVGGTSFTFKCDASDTSTYNWVLIGK